jgi:hypothetical protein
MTSMGRSGPQAALKAARSTSPLDGKSVGVSDVVVKYTI